MELNKKYVIIGLILLLITWTGNLFFYRSHMLSGPLFIKHYYDIKPGMGTFRLYYINNINPRDEVMYITFPEIETPLSTNEIEHRTDNRYYALNTIQVVTGVQDARNIPESLRNKIITKATVHLKSGRSEDVDIGKIYLYHEESDERNFNQVTNGSSNDNSGFGTFSGATDVKIKGINSRFPELTGSVFDIDIKINDKPLGKVEFPLDVKVGSNVTIGYKFKFDNNDLRKNNAYSFTLDIPTENPSGRQGTETVFVDYWLQGPELYDIDAMLQKGEVK